MFSYYKKLSSEVYDIDKYIGLSFGDVEFYSERLASVKGKILEPGVGTGRILIPLLEKGLNVEGFDVSKEMLSICQNNCDIRGLNPKLFEDKMETFEMAMDYEAIIVPTGTFLADKGKLILDIFLQTDVAIDQVSTRTWELENDEMITLENKLVEVDYINQYTIGHNRYEKWRQGELVQTELERFPLRWYGIEEFKMLLEQVGFEEIIISADYQYGQYPTKSSEIITFLELMK